MSNIAQELATLLETVERPGDFVASGTVDFGAPILRVEGVGQISLPLLPIQAQQIIATATQAPFGRGEQTILDTNVRRTWQLGPDRVQLGGKNWIRTLDIILERIAEGLGVSDPVEAQFYKLLVYDKESFFLPHRDTEKAAGMFATLVLVLPGESEGGELIVRHNGREQVLDLRRSDPGELGYAAFYADCVHEVRPVTSGHRLALTYNLVRKGKGAAPTAPNYARERARIVEALAGWSRMVAETAHVTGRPDGDEADGWDETPMDDDWDAATADDEWDEAPADDEWDEIADDDDDGWDEVPQKLVYPLQHAYTPAELAFAGLKGIDAAVGDVLRAAAVEAGTDLHLALLTIEESGWAEHTDMWRRGSRYEDQFEVGEVTDSDYTLTDWRRVDDQAAPFHAISVRPYELSPPDFLDEAKPDDEEFHEATGNEGASFDRTYKRAALVLWPEGTTVDIVVGAGLETALSYLENRVGLVAGGTAPSAARVEALRLAERLIAIWQRGAAAKEAARLLAALRQLGEGSTIAAAFDGVVAGGSYGRETVSEVVASLVSLAKPRQVGAVRAIVSSSADRRLNSLAALLAALAGSFADLLPEIRPVLQQFVDTLPTRRPSYDPVVRYETVDVGCVVDLIAALAAADAALSLQAVRHMLAHSGYFAFDGVLVAAAEKLASSADLSGHPAVNHLVKACRNHLEARIAEPLAPPADWRRPVEIRCDCEHCRSLTAFMADPIAEVWTLRARQEIRSHVETNIRNAACDLSCATLRKGSPHALICTKNQASYEKRVRQRRQDLEALAKLA
ncbi:2OG-Fe(II) oxygenase [Mesorhizobium sp. L-8-3]|uniref:2OG-Fe(II) oxygenase n=1 Tax=Mesorhizobium sp. L-8-3 TaxID=2744522 RepID=UPI001926C0ED|nr:2OG-Fe(II) oxygenase [Mesorhizobium sp. L-8-3]BCH22768.1 hypothetical protein MesoLjLb_25530 [Mesorhizobium sp. L-8-3]